MQHMRSGRYVERSVRYPLQGLMKVPSILPTEYTKDEVEHEEGAEDNEGDEEHPVPAVPLRVVGLQASNRFLTMFESTTPPNHHSPHT